MQGEGLESDYETAWSHYETIHIEGHQRGHSCAQLEDRSVTDHHSQTF